MTKVKSPSSDDANMPPDQDADLVAFLRQHAPPVPDADVGEEDRLMAAIAARQESALAPAFTATGRSWRARPLSKRLGMGVSFSILVYVLWQLYQVVMPTHRPVSELAELENFWVQSWDGVANAENAPPWLTESDSGLDKQNFLNPSHFYPSSTRQE